MKILRTRQRFGALLALLCSASLATGSAGPPRRGKDGGASAEALEVLRRAREVATTVKDAFERNSVLDLIAATQIQASSALDAFQTAMLVDDESERARLLASVAEAQASAGDIIGALQTAHTLPEAALAQKFWVLRRVSEQQVRRGDLGGAGATLEQAVQVALSHPDAAVRISFLALIAAQQKGMGDEIAAERTVRQTREIAARMEGEQQREEALAALARAEAQWGNLDAALETAGRLQAKESRDQALSWIAAEQMRLKGAGSAVQTLAEITDPSEKEFVGTSKVFLHLREGDVSAARHAAASLEDDGARARMMAYIAHALQEMGDRAGAATAFDQALALARRLPDTSHDKESVLGEIAEQLALAGSVGRAVEIAGSIKGEQQRASALQFAALSSVRRGDSSRAWALAEQREPPLVKAHILVGLAQGMLIRSAAERRAK